MKNRPKRPKKLETKRCYTCFEDKPLNQFHKQHNGTRGCAPSCKVCKRVYMKGYFQKNKAMLATKQKPYNEKWRKGNGHARVLEHARATRARRRVSLRGGDHILISDLYERDSGICGICEGSCEKNDASIDHIQPISKQGEHVWSNVQLAHLHCNRFKGASTLEPAGAP